MPCMGGNQRSPRESLQNKEKIKIQKLMDVFQCFSVCFLYLYIWRWWAQYRIFAYCTRWLISQIDMSTKLSHIHSSFLLVRWLSKSQNNPPWRTPPFHTAHTIMSLTISDRMLSSAIHSACSRNPSFVSLALVSLMLASAHWVDSRSAMKLECSPQLFVARPFLNRLVES